jgi:proteasome lid subunit RPN8/RPN11
VVLLNGNIADAKTEGLKLNEDMVKLANWKEYIQHAWVDFLSGKANGQGKYTRETFYESIWFISMNAFDVPREVQVLIDNNGNPFISVGNPGFVSFEHQDDELYNKTHKMSFPLIEWIHTHPFGQAYFSGTDLRTVALYRNHMKKATVLGDSERMTIKFDVGPLGEDYQEYVQHTWIGDEEE